MYRYFSNTDFKEANPPCETSDMDSEFLEKLDIARSFAGVPFIINSAFRTIGHELLQGRDGKSSHTKGVAVDIKAEGSRDRYLIIRGLLEAGFERIGIGKNFIHVDMDNKKDDEVMWHYYGERK